MKAHRNNCSRMTAGLMTQPDQELAGLFLARFCEWTDMRLHLGIRPRWWEEYTLPTSGISVLIVLLLLLSIVGTLSRCYCSRVDLSLGVYHVETPLSIFFVRRVQLSIAKLVFFKIKNNNSSRIPEEIQFLRSVETPIGRSLASSNVESSFTKKKYSFLSTGETN